MLFPYYQFQNVRPRKVLEAAKYLVKSSELFQNEHIEVQENWLDNPDTRGNDILANQSDEWKEFLSTSHSSLDKLKYIQIYLKLLFLNLLKDMIMMPNN